MLDNLNQIDWVALGEPQIPVWIGQFTSSDILKRREAIGDLRDDLTPWEVFDGLYSEELPRLVKREATYLIVPFLVEMLKSKGIEDKTPILALLHDLAWYRDIEIYVVEIAREQYRHYAQRLFDAVYKGIEIYRELAESEIYEVNRSAKSLLGMLEGKSEN
jgi:hypothetical protein